MRKSAPAFQFYPERFIAGTSQLTAAEVGGYIRLLCHEWTYGSVPGDSVRRLAPIMGMSIGSTKSAWAVVSQKFTRGDDGEWRNGMLERVRVEQENFRSVKQANGARGGRPAKTKQNQEVISEAEKQNLEITPPYSVLPYSDPPQNGGSEGTPHPVRDFLTLHERLFREHYGADPAGYTARDAKHAKDVIRSLGEARAAQLLEQFFRSRDDFIARSGHALGVFVTVQNKLIAELSGRKAGRTQAANAQQEQLDKNREVKRLIAEEGLSLAEASARVGFH